LLFLQRRNLNLTLHSVRSFPYSQRFVAGAYVSKWAGVHAVVQEKRIYKDSRCVCVCVCFFLYILYIFRRLCFSFPSSRMFFLIVGCPPFLYNSVPFLHLSLFLHYYWESIKEFVCFPFVFGFLFFFPSFCYCSHLYMYVCRRQMRAYRYIYIYRKKKTKGEEDEHTHTHNGKRKNGVSWTRLVCSFYFFFDLRSVKKKSNWALRKQTEKKSSSCSLSFFFSLVSAYILFFLSFISL
jgi:hypothetical protein